MKIKRGDCILNKRFGSLIVLWPMFSGFIPGKKSGPLHYVCLCDCGNFFNTWRSSIISGFTKSCGCLQKKRTSGASKTHGMTKTPTYKAWVGLRVRCYNKKRKDYDQYGGRGISVCERWSSFELFFEDMGERPSKNHSVDRIDNNGNYSPENCRWASAVEQANNRRNILTVEISGEAKSIPQWYPIYGSGPLKKWYDRCRRSILNGRPPVEVIRGY